MIKLNKAKKMCSSDMHMCCKECIAYLGKNVFLCNSNSNSFVNSAPVNCHRHYHISLSYVVLLQRCLARCPWRMKTP